MYRTIDEDGERYQVDENDHKQGEYTNYGGAGEINWRCMYQNDNLHGECKEYLHQGRVSRRSLWIDNKEVLELEIGKEYSKEEQTLFVLKFGIFRWLDEGA